jgi:hypothetical protein
MGGLLAACGSPEAVRLSGSVEGLHLALEQRALGTFLTGDFTLSLALGKFADDPATLRTVTLALTRAPSGEELGLGPLDATLVDADLPMEIEPGDEVNLDYELVANDPIATDATSLICDGPVTVRAAVEHSLDGGTTTTVLGPAVTPAGCE